jgi:hypothetical protein
MSTGLRPMTRSEKNMIERLLEDPFPGRDELLCQLDKALVAKIDENGSLEFSFPNSDFPKAKVNRRVVVEGELDDTDGVGVHVLLHVVDGALNELEVFKEDNSRVLALLDPKAITLIHLD